MTLKDKLVLVTAGSRGIGLACAARFAEEGSRVAICGRDEAALARAAETIAAAGGAAMTVAADLAVGADVERLTAAVLNTFGGLDVLVVNSGHVAYGGLDDLPDAAWQHAFDLLVMSAVRLTRAVIPAMRARGGGDIVFIGSASVREPPAHLLLSSVMRLGVVGLAKTLSRSLAGDNIRVNVVAPGYVATGRVQTRIAEKVASGIAPVQAMGEVAGDIPMRRIAEPREVAELVAFVASRRAGFMTGAHLPIDGGATRFPL